MGELRSMLMGNPLLTDGEYIVLDLVYTVVGPRGSMPHRDLVEVLNKSPLEINKILVSLSRNKLAHLDMNQELHLTESGVDLYESEQVLPPKPYIFQMTSHHIPGLTRSRMTELVMIESGPVRPAPSTTKVSQHITLDISGDRIYQRSA